jgi:uncharacterized protein
MATARVKAVTRHPVARRAPEHFHPALYDGGMLPGRAVIRFYGDLAGLVWDTDRTGEVEVLAAAPRSAKDAIESCGVPHTEVDLLVVNGRSVGFDHLVSAGDRVAAYPPFDSLDVGAVSLVRPPPLPEARFLLDVHLGRLAQLLRHVGLDADYDNDLDDAALAARAAEGPRWLLTRDRGLLMRRAVTHGYLVRSDEPRQQLIEVVRRFGLGNALAPSTRCARCNGMLHAVAKVEVLDRLLPATRREHDVFMRCADCGQVYWRGSHAAHLDELVADVRAAVGGKPRRDAG